MKKLLALTIAAAAFFAAAPAYAAITVGQSSGLSSGLVGHWTFDGSKTNWNTNTTRDSSGQGSTGTLTLMSTTTSPVAGKVGQAFSFPGNTNSFVNVGNGSSLNMTGSFTLSAWVYVTGGDADRDIFSKNAGSGNVAYLLEVSAGTSKVNLIAKVGGAIQALEGNTALSLNKWYHVVATYNGTTLKLYLNGIEDGSLSASGAVEVIGSALTLGARVNGAERFGGKLDDMRVYSRALSTAEVQQLYINGGGVLAKPNTTTLTTGLVGYWPFDGAQTNWNTNTTRDLGRGNTGTLVSLATTTAPVSGKVGQALNFNGTSSYVSGGDTGLPTGSSARTVTAWIYMRSYIDFETIFTYGSAIQFQGFSIAISSNAQGRKLAVYGYNNNASAFGNTQIPLNKWVHVAVTYSGGTITYYYNGIQDGTATLSSANTVLGGVYNIGKTINGWDAPSGTYFFPGSIDEVRVYSRALSASEIQQLYRQNNTATGQTSAVSGNTSGLVGHWTLDGAQTNWNTNTTKDSSGRGNTGTLTSLATTTAPVSGKVGQAMKFNGSTSEVIVPAHSSLNFGGSAITVSAWVNPASLSSTYHAVTASRSGCGGTNLNWQLYAKQDTNGPSFSVYNGGAGSGTALVATSSSPLPLNTWSHLTGTFDGTTTRLYINGILVASGTNGAQSTMNTVAAPLTIGREGPCTGWFNGKIDDVRVYSRTLSATEVLQLYTATK